MASRLDLVPHGTEVTVTKESSWSCPILQSVQESPLGIRMRIFASRGCADYARASYAVAGEARVARVTFVGLGEKLFGVSSIQAAMAPPRRRPRPPSPSPKDAVVHPSI